MTTTELERRFRPLALKAGLPLPRTQAQLGSHRVDFFWPPHALPAPQLCEQITAL